MSFIITSPSLPKLFFKCFSLIARECLLYLKNRIEHKMAMGGKLKEGNQSKGANALPKCKILVACDKCISTQSVSKAVWQTKYRNDLLMSNCQHAQSGGQRLTGDYLLNRLQLSELPTWRTRVTFWLLFLSEILVFDQVYVLNYAARRDWMSWK